MNYLAYLGGFLFVLFLFGWCFLAVGILGRGWFLFPDKNKNAKENPRR